MLRAGERRNEEVTVKGRVESQDSAGRARDGRMELRLPSETLRAVWSFVVSWFVISEAQSVGGVS